MPTMTGTICDSIKAGRLEQGPTGMVSKDFTRSTLPWCVAHYGPDSYFNGPSFASVKPATLISILSE
ncbi:hypothetical protein MPLSOD_10064 [Mesorhizobium sp. SOD10]|nr:hypothetical protein MPLSOD_10064 [Mesorhizobium sp. SOD10]